MKETPFFIASKLWILPSLCVLCAETGLPNHLAMLSIRGYRARVRSEKISAHLRTVDYHLNLELISM
jgi:hypothetical protein